MGGFPDRQSELPMSSAPSDAGAAFPELLLKTTPPRVPRHQLMRLRLSLADERFGDCPVVLVQAPPGFGKTSLLGQWRREHLAQGAAVAWVSADERYDLQRVCLPRQRQLVEALQRQGTHARPAADVEHLAGDESRVPVREEEHRPRHVVGLP